MTVFKALMVALIDYLSILKSTMFLIHLSYIVDMS